MVSNWVIVGVAGLAVSLSGCGYAGTERRRVQSQEEMTIAGRACVLSEVRHETNSINGTHAWIETRVACGERSIDCQLDPREVCLTRVRAALAPRA